MQAELNGDTRLTLPQRFAYLAINFARNLKPGIFNGRVASFTARRLASTPNAASPGRALTEAFSWTELPRILPRKRLSVLEIGCGSGRLTNLLAALGYSGSYVGIDINDKFDHSTHPQFDRRFVQIDAHQFQPDQSYDLIISISALEHIPNDRDLIQNLGRLLAPGGLQVHVVPSGCGLLTYLWHGYRQYTRASIGERFGSKETTIYLLGGAPSFALHLLWITIGEMLFRLRCRRWLPSVYGRLLDACLATDRFIPLCATMYAVCQPSKVIQE